LDVEWNGVQLHNGIVSLSFGRRSPLGPGLLRWCLRVETGLFPNTDNQLLGALDEMRQTSAVLLVGWGAGFGSRLRKQCASSAVKLPAMGHIFVTRFSVPRSEDPLNALRHAEPEWLEGRLDLFRRFFVPSVGRIGVPAVLLCSSESAAFVSDRVADLSWIDVVVQDEWYGGWTGDSDQVVTRMDSDDAIHGEWLATVDAAPVEAEVCCTREFLRYDDATGRLCAYSRSDPSPLAAFRGGRNPFAHDHAELTRHYRVHDVRGPYLLQVFHGGNVSSRRPSWYRRRLPLERLQAFGIDASTVSR
jgi:hypothetical protein